MVKFNLKNHIKTIFFSFLLLFSIINCKPIQAEDNIKEYNKQEIMEAMFIWSFIESSTTNVINFCKDTNYIPYEYINSFNSEFIYEQKYSNNILDNLPDYKNIIASVKNEFVNSPNSLDLIMDDYISLKNIYQENNQELSKQDYCKFYDDNKDLIISFQRDRFREGKARLQEYIKQNNQNTNIESYTNKSQAETTETEPLIYKHKSGMNDADKQRIANIFGKENYDELMQHNLEEEQYEDDYDRYKLTGSYEQQLERVQREAALPDFLTNPKYKATEDASLTVEQLVERSRDLNLQNKDYRQKEYKEAIHEHTHLDSLEHYLINMIGGIFSPNKKVIMSIDGAKQYAKEQGGYWDTDNEEKGTVTKYEVDTYIKNEQLKQKLRNEIAEYSKYNDYTKWDRISLMYSAISGRLGNVLTFCVILLLVMLIINVIKMVIKKGKDMGLFDFIFGNNIETYKTSSLVKNMISDCYNLAHDKCEKKFNEIGRDFFTHCYTVEYIIAVKFAINSIIKIKQINYISAKQLEKAIEETVIEYALKHLKEDVPYLTRFEMNSINMIRNSAYNQILNYCNTNGPFCDNLEGIKDENIIISALRNLYFTILLDHDSYNHEKLPFIHAQDIAKYSQMYDTKSKLQSPTATDLSKEIYNIAIKAVNNIETNKGII